MAACIFSWLGHEAWALICGQSSRLSVVYFGLKTNSSRKLWSPVLIKAMIMQLILNCFSPVNKMTIRAKELISPQILLKVCAFDETSQTQLSCNNLIINKKKLQSLRSAKSQSENQCKDYTFFKLHLLQNLMVQVNNIGQAWPLV